MRGVDLAGGTHRRNHTTFHRRSVAKQMNFVRYAVDCVDNIIVISELKHFGSVRRVGCMQGGNLGLGADVEQTLAHNFDLYTTNRC